MAAQRCEQALLWIEKLGISGVPTVGGKIVEVGEVQSAAFISGRKASEVVEPIEASLDAVAVFVGGRIR